MAWKLSNFMQSTLQQACLAADTTLYIDADEVDNLPTLGVGEEAPLILFDGANREIVYITAWVTNGTLTVTRAREGTTALDWGAGTITVHTPTASMLQNVLDATSAISFGVGTTTSAANVYTTDLGSGASVPSLANGERLTFIPDADNSGNADLIVTDGTSPTTQKSILNLDGTELEPGMLETDTPVVVQYDVTAGAWLLITPLASRQGRLETLNTGPIPAINRHPNGSLKAWNNGTSFSTPASDSETADGWFAQYDGTIGAFSVSRQSFTLGQTDVPGQPDYYLRWDQSAAGSGSTYRRLRVKIPRVGWRNGKKVLRSVWAKADSSRNVDAKIIQHFGSGGSPSSDVTVDTTTLALTTSWQQFSIPDTMPSISGKVLGSGGDDAIYLDLELPVNVTLTVDVAMDDLRQGNTLGDVDATWPVDLRFGGTGGSFASSSALAAGLGIPTLADLASTANGDGASTIGVEDSAANFTATTVEGALAELASDLASLGTPVQLRGTWDASAGTFPGGGSAQAGWSYIVSVGGTVDSVDFVAGDRIVAIVNNASTATYAANWVHLDYSDKVSSVAGRTGNVTLAQADISGLTTASSPTFAGLTLTGNAALPSGHVFSWNAGDVTLTHSANTLSGAGGALVWSYDGAAATSPTRVVNTTDNASVLAGAFEGDRATPANNDTVYSVWRLSSAAGVQTDVFRIKITNFNVTAGAENPGLYLALNNNGTMTDYLYLGKTQFNALTDAVTSLGAAAKGWNNCFLKDGAYIDFGDNSARITHNTADDSFTVSNGGLQSGCAVSTETTGALTSASRNRIVRCSGNVTLPSSGMTDGDCIMIDPRGTARTVTRPGSHTMYIDDVDSATGTTNAHNIVVAVYHSSSKWTLNGAVA